MSAKSEWRVNMDNTTMIVDSKESGIDIIYGMHPEYKECPLWEDWRVGAIFSSTGDAPIEAMVWQYVDNIPCYWDSSPEFYRYEEKRQPK